jgi:aerobic carbon-monoxide dehydrogenase small subunit
VIEVSFTLNGAPVTVVAPADRPLTAILRDDLSSTGTKLGCAQGRCGACMVLLDGAAVNACLLMGWQLAGRDVVTVEGLRDDPRLVPLFDALADANAFQCGYCAPGIVVALAGLVARDPAPDDAAILSALDGHLCRCTGYRSILMGARAAVHAMQP